uniref:Putative aldo/keto reductase family n=1 Tax=Panstrongylus lignarius TaxID=156445 RepID=A0A224XG42_9HEMI
MAFKPFVTFNNGNCCPLLGLGTWNSKPGEVEQAIKDAIDIGYRHFDCAHIYLNEKEIGAALNEKIKEGVVSRDGLFITSKLWNTFHKQEQVVPALKTTLANLGLEYIDLYLIHWPMGFKEDGDLFPKDENDKVLYSDTHFTETWRGMEECVKEGLTKSIGLSNFNSRQIQEILDIASIKPVNNQVECHSYLNQTKLYKFCQTNGITLTAYSPLGSPARPMAKPDDPNLLKDPKLKELGDKYNKTPAQILIRYQIERDIIVIPKSVNKDRLQSNFDSLSFTLFKDDMKILDGLDKQQEGRMLKLENVADHKDYPFSIEY